MTQVEPLPVKVNVIVRWGPYLQTCNERVNYNPSSYGTQKWMAPKIDLIMQYMDKTLGKFSLILYAE